jgi:hypothetical protein
VKDALAKLGLLDYICVFGVLDAPLDCGVDLWNRLGVKYVPATTTLVYNTL